MTSLVRALEIVQLVALLCVSVTVQRDYEA